ncbi:MAG: DNA polymerase III subunit gamma/tau [Clostridia bacterium]|nr:DNA polymerase III subunit gamma/tau [Clostridia bacterium]
MADSYQALYRKWRPMTFDDVVGQKHVSDTLKTGIATGRIAHAYLFCGTRGTGKTSTAKIFSRAVNCENPQNGEPCNACATCRGILDGSILDVYEMDAASNRSIEDIRVIRDEIIYTPAGCTYKVYIIDEVHMLTTEAFNALLKTLEEPPKHALFILATTEPHKIPATVLSRCQRFDFRRIGVDDIADRLSQIVKAEGIDATPDALELVAELGDGSMRDALSLLDQCAAYGYETLTSALIGEIVGIVDSKTLFSITDAIAKGDTKEALIQTDGFLHRGKEVQTFLEDLTSHFRSLLICKAAQDVAELLERTPEAAAKFQAQAETMSTEQIIYAIGVLSEALAQSKWMATPQVAAEVAMVKLCNLNYSNEPDALLARLEKLERMLAQGVTAAPKSAVKPEPDSPPWQTEPKPEPEEVKKEEIPKPVEKPKTPEDAALWEYWADALQEVKGESKLLYAFLSNAKGFLNGDIVEIELSNKVAYDKIATPNGLEYLSNLFGRIAGTPLRAEAVLAGEREKKQNSASIFDIAKKKDLLGDTLNIIQNQD